MNKAVKTHFFANASQFLNTSLSLFARKNIVYVFGLPYEFDLYNLLNLARNKQTEFSTEN